MIGVVAAIGAAFAWTIACFMWKEQTKYYSIIQINLIKNLIAFIIFCPILISLDLFNDSKNIFILLMSGIIGIALGDSLYIIALKRIGTRKTLTFEALSPILANILGSIIIGESTSYKVWFGTIIVTLSLVIIANEENINFKKEITRSTSKDNGYLFAFLSVLCAVIAAILSRFVLINSDLSPFVTTEIRLLGSLFVLAPIVKFNLRKDIIQVPNKTKLRLIIATILGTNLGILLQQTVFQILPIGIGWTLLSTSPVISLFLAKREGDQITLISVLMSLTTLLGVGIIFI